MVGSESDVFGLRIVVVLAALSLFQLLVFLAGGGLVAILVVN